MGDAARDYEIVQADWDYMFLFSLNILLREKWIHKPDTADHSPKTSKHKCGELARFVCPNSFPHVAITVDQMGFGPAHVTFACHCTKYVWVRTVQTYGLDLRTSK
jgi:hypothetical protein